MRVALKRALSIEEGKNVSGWRTKKPRLSPTQSPGDDVPYGQGGRD